MIKHPNARSIGTFVILGLALLISGALVFSAGELFADKKTYVSYFNQNVTGLSEGAPVSFRGVQVGVVTSVSIVLVEVPGNELAQLRPRVEWEVFTGKVRTAHSKVELVEVDVDTLVEKGVRATLEVQSLITGQLYLSLNYFPSQAPRFLADESEQLTEIPSLDRSLSDFLKKLEGLPYLDLISQAIDTFRSIEALANNPDLKQTLSEARTLTADAARAVNTLDDLLQTEARPLLRNTNQTVTSARQVLQKDVRNTLAQLDRTMESADQTLQTARTLLDENSSAYQQLLRTMRNFSDAARSIKSLSDYLERHPEAILRGKP